MIDIVCLMYYFIRMIKSFKNAKSRKVFETGNPKGFKGLDGEMAVEQLDMLDAAISLKEISPLISVGLHKLKGNRKDQWAIDVNGPWRICFIPAKGGGWDDVEIVDYH